MNLTDQEIEVLVQEVTHDVAGPGQLTPEATLKFLEPALSDKVMYSDKKKQMVLETIIIGSTLEDAWAGLTDEEDRKTRSKILFKYLGQIGIHITFA